MSIRRRLALVGLAFAGLNLYARRAVRNFEDLDLETPEAPGSYLDVDGVRLHYVEAGTGEPVVMLHGLNASTYSFRYAIPELAQSYRAVALDLKGFGYSERPRDSDYSLTAQADLVASAMNRLNIERAAVVGHSMGGDVAMRLALRHPQRVSRLVLVSSATDEQMRRGLRAARILRPFLPIVAVFTTHRTAYQRRALHFVTHDPAFVTPEVIECSYRPQRMRGHRRALGALLVDRARDEPLTPERIATPTLILWGEHDRLLPPSQGERLLERIPNARFVLVPSSGHRPLEEQPGFCNRALLEFLESREVTAIREPRPVAEAEATS